MNYRLSGYFTGALSLEVNHFNIPEKVPQKQSASHNVYDQRVSFQYLNHNWCLRSPLNCQELDLSLYGQAVTLAIIRSKLR